MCSRRLRRNKKTGAIFETAYETANERSRFFFLSALVHKRACAAHELMFALGQKRAYAQPALRQMRRLKFDHVGPGQRHFRRDDWRVGQVPNPILLRICFRRRHSVYWNNNVKSARCRSAASINYETLG